eukprot:9206220-Pyramimonas_sp.AAC.1
MQALDYYVSLLRANARISSLVDCTTMLSPHQANQRPLPIFNGIAPEDTPPACLLVLSPSLTRHRRSAQGQVFASKLDALADVCRP